MKHDNRDASGKFTPVTDPQSVNLVLGAIARMGREIDVLSLIRARRHEDPINGRTPTTASHRTGF